MVERASGRIGNVWEHRPKDEMQHGLLGDPCFRLVIEAGKATLGCWEFGGGRTGSEIVGIDVLWVRVS